MEKNDPVRTAGGGTARAGRHALMLVLLAVVLHACSPPAAGASSGEVRLLAIEGVINPVTARYLPRELEEAARARAEAVVIRLDTPVVWRARCGR